MPKICFVTSLYSDQNNFDTPGSFEKDPRYDYFLFTNIDGIKSDWEVINTSNVKEIQNIRCNIRKSRYAKFLSWDILEKMGKSYDYIVYCDAYITPKLTDWEKQLKNIDNLRFGFTQREHPEKFVRNKGIVQECNLIVRCGKDSLESIQKTLKFFEEEYQGVPLDYPQYYENTVFAYKFDCKTFRDLSSEFWEVYTKKDITYRDQPLWNLLLLKNNLKPVVNNEFKSNFRENGVMHNGHVYPR